MKKILILLFSIIILLPIVFFNTDSKKTMIMENRRVIAFPKKFSSKKMDNYISDNIGFKNEMLFIKKIIDYKIFNRFHFKNLSRGKNNHYFFHDKPTDPNFSGKEKMSKRELALYTSSFIDVKNFFESYGAKFYLVAMPNKESVYPEFYTNSISKEKDNLYDKAFKILEKKDINSLHLKEMLLREKKNNNYPLYYKIINTAHWNNNGAFVGYTNIMKMFKKDFQNLKILTRNDFNITQTEVKRSVFNSPPALAFLQKYMDATKETYFNFKQKYPKNITLIKNKPLFLVYDKNSPHPSFNYTYHDIENKKTLLIIGDSYIYSFMLPWIAHSFKKVYFVYNYLGDKKYIEKLLKKLHPDLVLYQFVERMENYKSQIYVNSLYKTKKTNYGSHGDKRLTPIVEYLATGSEGVKNYGIYDDKWLAPTAEFSIKGQNKNTLYLKGYCPKKIESHLTGKISINGILYNFQIKKQSFCLKHKIINPSNKLDIKITNNFSFKANPPDKRFLSFILQDIYTADDNNLSHKCVGL